VPGLIRSLRERHPALRVLLMSGYSSSTLAQHGIGGERFLAKPFSVHALLHTVRAALDQEPEIEPAREPAPA
jgi:DNA-binding NtrC family response regulator